MKQDVQGNRSCQARDFCQPVYEAWLTEAIAIGRIDAPGYFTDPLIRKAWSNAEWYGPVMGVLDPVKEVEASGLRVQLGLSTREKESAEMTGTSWDENVERLAIEQQRMNELGIPNSQITAKKSVQEKGGDEGNG